MYHVTGRRRWLENGPPDSFASRIIEWFLREKKAGIDRAGLYTVCFVELS
jgi:hypothetical protein